MVPPLPGPCLAGAPGGQMAKVHQGDLKLSPEETGCLFHEIKRLPLTDAQVNLLHDKTNGWITELQLAANFLSNRGSSSGLPGKASCQISSNISMNSLPQSKFIPLLTLVGCQTPVFKILYGIR